jgi:hypothetical protein
MKLIVLKIQDNNKWVVRNYKIEWNKVFSLL